MGCSRCFTDGGLAVQRSCSIFVLYTRLSRRGVGRGIQTTLAYIQHNYLVHAPSTPPPCTSD